MILQWRKATYEGHYWDSYWNSSIGCQLEYPIESTLHVLTLTIVLLLHKRTFLFLIYATNSPWSKRAVCVCVCVCVERERMKERKKMWQDIKTYESEWRDTQWRSFLYYSCNFWANLKLYQNKITKTKDSCLEYPGRSVLPSDACEQGDASVLQPQGSSAIGQSRLCGWKSGKTDRTRALTGIPELPNQPPLEPLPPDGLLLSAKDSWRQLRLGSYS